MNKLTHKLSYTLSYALSHATLLSGICLALTACGGGGSGTQTATPTQPTQPVQTTWQLGVYPASSELQNLCANPRTGIDEYTGTRFADKTGSAFLEKMWLRSWTNETYLWANEVADKDPNSFSDVASYFAQLKTTATTASGKPKDYFHFSRSYEDYAKESLKGETAGYGVHWAFLSNVPPRVLKVAYVTADTAATQAGLQRGDQILAIDGVDINDSTETGIAALNAALSPQQGKSHQFLVKTVLGEQRQITMTASNYQQRPVQGSKVIEHAGKKIGYVQFNQFISVAQPDLISTIELFRNSDVNALVLDMRYNGGGLLALSSQLGYMIAGPGRTSGRVFSKAIDNGKGNLYDNAAQQTTAFYNREIDYQAGKFTNTALPDLDLDTVYILTTGNTCSASESLINGLLGIDVNVVLIGTTTCGKPYGFFPTQNCGTVYYSIQFKGSNEKGFADFTDGFSPTQNPQTEAQVKGCTVSDDFNHALGNEQEAMLAGALQHLATGQCPAAKPQLAPRPAPDGKPLAIPSNVFDNGTIVLPLREI
ncbi:S41 family peptidase [Pseudoalteromonas fenneropenaei]|uniref:S41 family peptidase n=1 Tax=Pseudoalteromonas fenneropenaei TaxID=1737459 RepID=A0ABV7CLZ3_9GAMM